jgi:hypothetical protein
MSEPDFQLAFARLLTDSTARHAFLSGDDFALGDLQPGTRERLAPLRREGRRGLEFFGDLLAQKLARAVRGLTPLLARYLGEERWAKSWQAHRATRVESIATITAEAIEFVNQIRNFPGVDCARQRQLADVCDVELACLRVAARESIPLLDPAAKSPQTRPPGTAYPIAVRPLMTCRVTHDLTPLLRTEAPSRPDLDSLSAPATYAAYRPDGSSAVLLARIGAAHAKILMLCDGHTTPAELTGRLFGVRHSVRAERAIERALEALAAVGLVIFLESAISQDQRGALRSE